MNNNIEDSDTKELHHTLQIIQNKILECNNSKREVIRKKTTKRALLQEAYQVLQNDLQNALLEDNPLLRKTPKSVSAPSDLLPLLTSPTTEPVEDLPTSHEIKKTEGIELVRCSGWLRSNNRVWIQSNGFALLDIQEAYLNCSPNSILPESIRLNSYDNTGENRSIYLYCSFDLLPDVQIVEIMKTLKISCVYKYEDQYFQTELHDIEWNGANDSSWTNYIPIIPSMVLAYFPYHITVNEKMTIGQLKNTVDDKGLIIDDVYLLLEDQSCIIRLFSNERLVIYGSLPSTILKLTSLFHGSFSSDTVGCNEKDVIVSLGDIVNTNMEFITTRARVAFNLSYFS